MGQNDEWEGICQGLGETGLAVSRGMEGWAVGGACLPECRHEGRGNRGLPFTLRCQEPKEEIRRRKGL